MSGRQWPPRGALKAVYADLLDIAQQFDLKLPDAAGARPTVVAARDLLARLGQTLNVTDRHEMELSELFDQVQQLAAEAQQAPPVPALLKLTREPAFVAPDWYKK